MRLFTVGPVMMFPETLEASGRQLPYFRTDEFSELMLDSEQVFKRLVGAPDGSKVAFLTSSGTGAMEAVVGSCFTPSDRLLIVIGGGFGRRFGEICDVHGIPHDDVVLDWDETLTEEHLMGFAGCGHAGLLVNVDETSTGQHYDLAMLSRFCRENSMFLIVDAISSFLADRLVMSEGADAVIVSSQKALALEPGISIVALSGRLYDRVLGIDSHMYYLDIRKHVENQVRGQTPFTPAVGTLICLNDMLHMVDAEGIDSKVAHTAELASYFRVKARDAGLTIPDYPLSNAVTPIVFDGDAYEVYRRLRSEHDITVTPSGGDLKGILLRVGHIGNLSKEDYDVLIDAMMEVMQ